MKPLFMRFKRKDAEMIINMNHVAHIMRNGRETNESVLTFNQIINGDPAYLIVDESIDAIGQRSEWK